MEEKAYYFDELFFRQNKKEHEFLLKPLNDLAKAYSQLELKKKFDREMLLKATGSPNGWINGLKSELIKTLEKTNLPKAIHKAFDTEIESQIGNLSFALNEVRRCRDIAMTGKLHKDVMINFQFYDVNEKGEVFLLEDEMKELATVYVSNEKQMKVLNQLEAANEHFSAIKKIMEANGIMYQMITATNEREGVLVFEGEKYKIAPDVLRKIK